MFSAGFEGQSRLRVIAYIVVILVSLIGLTRAPDSSQRVTFFEATMMRVFAPLQEQTVSMRSMVSSFFEHYILLVGKSKENRELRTKIAELNTEILQLAELKQENQRLKKLLRFGENIKRDKVLSQVVGWDTSNQFRAFRINKGTADGIRERSPVITARGLIGHVYRSSAHYSDVLTILDPSTRVDATLSKSRSKGILEGRGGELCDLKYIGQTEDVEKGEKLFTAGLGTIYPKGIFIGVVESVEKGAFRVTQEISIRPAVDFRRLEEVVVLVNVEEERVD